MVPTPSLAVTTALSVITAQVRHRVQFHVIQGTIPVSLKTRFALYAQLALRVPSPTLPQSFALPLDQLVLPATLLMMEQQVVIQWRLFAILMSINIQTPVPMEQFVQRVMPVIIVTQHLRFVLEDTTLRQEQKNVPCVRLVTCVPHPTPA